MRLRSASPNQVLGIVCVGITLANLDLFIVNVALPDIARSFRSATLEDLSWILNGYAIAYAALLVFFGRLAERHHRNHSFLLGVGLFTAASARLRRRLERRGAGGLPARAGGGRGPDDADLARPAAGDLSAGPTRRCRAHLDRRRRPRRRARPDDRRRPRDLRLALDLPRQRAGRACRAARRLATSAGCPRAGSEAPERRRRRPRDRRYRSRHLCDHKGQRLGLAVARGRALRGRVRAPARPVRAALCALGQPVHRSVPVPHPAVHGSGAGHGALLGRVRRDAAVDRALRAERVGILGAAHRPHDHAGAVDGAADLASRGRAADRAVRPRGRRDGRSRELRGRTGVGGRRRWARRPTSCPWWWACC